MLQKSTMLRTLEIFFLNPTKGHYLKDISRKIKIAHTSVKKNLNELVKFGIIKENIEKRGKRKFPIYKADIHNKTFRKYKIIYNISSLIESNLIDFIEEKLSPKSIVVFGSYQKGEDIETSDIDIFVECKKEELSLAKFEKILNRKIELHFNNNFFSYPKELKNNIVNGMVLSGFLVGYK